MWRALPVAAVCIAAAFAGEATAETPLTLPGRALRSGDVGGLAAPSRAVVVTSAVDWWQGSRSRASMRRAGFVRGLRETLDAKAYDGVRGYCLVAEFRTATEARDEVAKQLALSRAPAPSYAAFAVANVPGAHGFTTTGPGQQAYSVIFSDGRFQYWIGLAGSAAVRAPLEAQVIAAAQALYRRVHGR